MPGSNVIMELNASIDNNPIFNKPIGTKRITYLFNKKFSKNLSESRIGEIIAHVKCCYV